jgi:hypothetical protein
MKIFFKCIEERGQTVATNMSMGFVDSKRIETKSLSYIKTKELCVDGYFHLMNFEGDMLCKYRRDADRFRTNDSSFFSQVERVLYDNLDFR